MLFSAVSSRFPRKSLLSSRSHCLRRTSISPSSWSMASFTCMISWFPLSARMAAIRSESLASSCSSDRISSRFFFSSFKSPSRSYSLSAVLISFSTANSFWARYSCAFFRMVSLSSSPMGRPQTQNWLYASSLKNSFATFLGRRNVCIFCNNPCIRICSSI